MIETYSYVDGKCKYYISTWLFFLYYSKYYSLMRLLLNIPFQVYTNKLTHGMYTMYLEKNQTRLNCHYKFILAKNIIFISSCDIQA